ncbi:CACTA en-spm transposon protein [Cucumis melo var. makuwa]|uniref:CACTA en-spm transposon protein n=1 Tax=Cucumis melo var. makuwa TaxID=1194695 RepID=A0A5D3D4X0_CUCMM|nr:CACTA en-spm transposon protein [Cucumis melo var. makuwa]TYK18593.1 CACTA en-spm transposon protein [Cucumis melo var. makuwa]
MLLLTPGPRSPDREIDVYPQPFIEELKELLNFGLSMYDSLTALLVHLAVHLAYETKVTGPISYSWMYPIERSLRTLKQYVWNKACLEGSITEAYVMNESSTFCSRYLSGVETRFTIDERNDDTIPKDKVIVDDVENEQLNVLEIVVEHQVDEHIEDDILCRTDVDPTIVGRPVVCHVTNDFIDNGNDQLCFLEFVEDLNNLTEGSFSVDDNLGTSQPSATSTPRRCVQSRLLELERYVHANERILMLIASNVKKPISPHVVRFSQIIDVCVKDISTFVVLNFNDQAMNRAKSFLQRQHELAEQREKSVNRVELFQHMFEMGLSYCWTQKSNAGTLILAYTTGFSIILWERDSEIVLGR